MMITKQKARELRRKIEKAAISLDDTDAVDAPELYPAWDGNGVRYTAGQRIRDGEKLYRVAQTHTSQQDWSPANTPALFTEVAKPGEIPVWRQPTGAQDAYMTGDKVYFPNEGDPVYVSTVDNNVWQPGVYGWELAT
jgi:hypothetical protein